MVLLGLTVGWVSCGVSFCFCLRFVLFLVLSWLVVFVGLGFYFNYCTVLSILEW